MGLGDFIEEAEKATTGQGGQDGDNNANNANGSNDKSVDTMVDSGESTSRQTSSQETGILAIS